MDYAPEMLSDASGFKAFKELISKFDCLFVCGGSLTSGQLVKGSFQKIEDWNFAK